MSRKLGEGAGNALGCEVAGKLTEEGFEGLAEEFEAAVAEHAKVRLLVRIPRMPDVEFGALAEDVKLALYADDIDRYTIVGDSVPVGWAEKVGNLLVGGEVRHFEDRQYDKAWRGGRS